MVIDVADDVARASGRVTDAEGGGAGIVDVSNASGAEDGEGAVEDGEEGLVGRGVARDLVLGAHANRPGLVHELGPGADADLEPTSGECREVDGVKGRGCGAALG